MDDKHKALAEHLAKTPVPDKITVTISYGDGETVDFHFVKSSKAYNRYMNDTLNERDYVYPARQLLIDTVVEDERELLVAFMDRYEAIPVTVAAELTPIYGTLFGSELKNV